MTKEEMDIQLIEACILEKWNPMAAGCIPVESTAFSCCLCQVYGYYATRKFSCTGCPVEARVDNSQCYNTPYVEFDNTLWQLEEVLDIDSMAVGYSLEDPADYDLFLTLCDAIEAEIEFLISLLPKDHPWRLE